MTNQEKANFIHELFHGENGTGPYNPTEGLALCYVFAEDPEYRWLRDLMVQEGFIPDATDEEALAA